MQEYASRQLNRHLLLRDALGLDFGLKMSTVQPLVSVSDHVTRGAPAVLANQLGALLAQLAASVQHA